MTASVAGLRRLNQVAGVGNVQPNRTRPGKHIGHLIELIYTIAVARSRPVLDIPPRTTALSRAAAVTRFAPLVGTLAQSWGRCSAMTLAPHEEGKDLLMTGDNPFRILGTIESDASLILNHVRGLRFETNTHGRLQGIRAAAERLRDRACELIEQLHGKEEEAHG